MMENINRYFAFHDVWNYISSLQNEEYFIPLKEALVYWEKQNNFDKLMDVLFPNRDFFLGEIIDFKSLNTINLGFDRNFYEDFDDIFEIERKSYIANNSEESSFQISLCYELKRVNY